jgi:hypothetical protein
VRRLRRFPKCGDEKRAKKNSPFLGLWPKRSSDNFFADPFFSPALWRKRRVGGNEYRYHVPLCGPSLAGFFTWFTRVVANRNLVGAPLPNIRRTGRAAARGPGSRFPRPSFALKFEGLERIKQKSCLSTVWRKAPKRASSFLPAPSLQISGTAAGGAQAGSPFLWGTFLLAKQKNKCLACRGETRLATGDYTLSKIQN